MRWDDFTSVIVLALPKTCEEEGTPRAAWGKVESILIEETSLKHDRSSEYLSTPVHFALPIRACV